MTIICTICITDLNTNISVALPCGHLFHRNCIETWLNNTAVQSQFPSCPLCKRCIPQRDMIIPLYFSTNDNVEAETPVNMNDKITIEELEKETEILRNEKRMLGERLSDEKSKMAALTEEIQRMRSLEERHGATMRYLKQLKRVAEIDDYLSQPTTQAYLANLSRLPRPELIVALGGLKEKCVEMANQRDIAQKKAAKAKAREDQLAEIVGKLSKKIDKLKGKDKLKPKSFNPLDFLKFGEPSGSRSIIIVDSEDDTDDEFHSTHSGKRLNENKTVEEEIPYSSSDESDGDNLLYTDVSGVFTNIPKTGKNNEQSTESIASGRTRQIEDNEIEEDYRKRVRT